MIYILETINKIKFEISEEEYKGYLRAKSDDHLTFKNGVSIKKTMIAAIYPKNLADMIEDRKNQTRGFLHDGTPVFRHFGQWVCDSGQVPDDNGNYQPVKLDPDYYPEVARDCVFTTKEWEEYKSLPVLERKEKILLLGGGRNIQSSQNKFSSIGEIFKQLDTKDKTNQK